MPPAFSSLAPCGAFAFLAWVNMPGVCPGRLASVLCALPSGGGVTVAITAVPLACWRMPLQVFSNVDARCMRALAYQLQQAQSAPEWFDGAVSPAESFPVLAEANSSPSPLGLSDGAWI